MAIKTFQKGTGCFKCEGCGRQTRATGEQAVGVKLCPECWDLAGYYNEWQDDYFKPEEIPACEALLKALVAKGGDGAKVLAEYGGSILPAPEPAKPAEEPTPEGLQLVIAGCEKVATVGKKQLELW